MKQTADQLVRRYFKLKQLLEKPLLANRHRFIFLREESSAMPIDETDSTMDIVQRLRNCPIFEAANEIDGLRKQLYKAQKDTERLRRIREVWLSRIASRPETDGWWGDMDAVIDAAREEA